MSKQSIKIKPIVDKKVIRIKPIAGRKGNDGWSPVLSIIPDAPRNRRVFQITDWIGGEGIKPQAGLFVGETELVTDIEQAATLSDIFGIDNEPTESSTNLVYSGGVFTAIEAVDIDSSSVNKSETYTIELIKKNGSVVPIEFSQSFRHIQTSNSDEWQIIHNLGYRPSITVVDLDGNIVNGDVSYDTNNQLTLTFAEPLKGEAYLN